eukprot:TRINITY_DN4506_c0_g1_i1.p1 TRINITY_DN4506_c0_g1~~TRINITY_DN4506_c0_g1_i1.p1  ORF type:complete len:113 (+),score=15.08 TRINITY_DN4506_c0_g1_i1:317-655(+)
MQISFDFNLIQIKCDLQFEPQFLSIKLQNYYYLNKETQEQLDSVKQVTKNTANIVKYLLILYQIGGIFIERVDVCKPVSYTHLTLPTKRIVQISVVAVYLKKKLIHISIYYP